MTFLLVAAIATLATFAGEISGNPECAPDFSKKTPCKDGGGQERFCKFGWTKEGSQCLLTLDAGASSQTAQAKCRSLGADSSNVQNGRVLCQEGTTSKPDVCLDWNLELENEDAVIAKQGPLSIRATKNHSGPLLLLMLDPDARSYATSGCGYWLHWVVFLPQGFKNGELLDTSEELVGYHPPGPPAGSGPHRYQVVIAPFAAPSGHPLTIARDLLHGVAREQFDPTTLARDLGLGPAVATLQFQVSHVQQV